jgi:hypothetical protein
VDEFLTVSVSLSAQNVEEDKNDDIVDGAGWILNNAVSNQEDSSDILETVAGQKEGNTGSFNSISEDWLNFFVDSTFVIDFLDVVDEGQKLSLSFHVIGVLI